MKFIGDSKLKSLLKNWVFWLLLFAGFAIIIRSLPAWINAAWGCDFGIYFGITKSIAETKMIFPPYTGWGSSYNQFPILYLINAFSSWITGLDVLTLMPKLTPIFGGLSVLIFYFVVNELIDNKKIALICTLFFAFMPFHVYQTSHASPLTVGHFFIMLSLLMFIRFRKNTKYFIPLLIFTMLLIMSHHLSTYFYLITLIGILFVENVSVKEWTPTLKKDVIYILITSVLIFTYWGVVAKTVYADFMTGFNFGGIRIQSIFIIILFYFVFACLLGIIKIIRRINDYIIWLNTNVKSPVKRFFFRIIWRFYPFIRKRWPSTRSRKKIFLSIMFVTLFLMFYFSVVKMPWTGFSFTISSIIIAIPLIVALAFGVAGFRYTAHIKNGFFIRGWIFAIAISFIVMLITDNTAIFPHRHLEYIMAPLAILIVYGIGGIFSDPYYKGILTKFKTKKSLTVNYKLGKIKIPQKNRLLPIFVIILLVVSLAVTTYEVHRSLNQSWEEITTEDIRSIEWMGLNLDKNTSIITSDHRLERMTEAEGFNTTKDEVVLLWAAVSTNEYIEELIGVGKNYSRITHIIIDDIMKYQGVHIGPKKGDFRTVYMTNETWNASYLKFQQQPFELIYRNETIDINPETTEPVHWAEVYKINWTYIEESYLENIYTS